MLRCIANKEKLDDQTSTRAYAVGRAMVRLLRYDAEKLDLEEGQEGEHWVQVHKAIIAINRIVRKTIAGFDCTEEDIQNEVENSVQQHNGPRFELLISGPEKWVRATNVELYRERHRDSPFVSLTRNKQWHVRVLQ